MGMLRKLRQWREKADRTLEGPALSTGRAENSDIDDGVDYLDPRWFARTDAVFIYTRFNTLDGFSTGASGSGNVDVALARLTLDTGTTSGSTADLQDRSLRYIGAGGTIPWGDPHTVAVAFGVKSSANDGVVEFMTADRTGSAYYGIRYDGASGELLFVASVGGEETTAVVESNYTDQDDTARFEFDPSGSLSVSLASGPSAELTDGVPSGGWVW